MKKLYSTSVLLSFPIVLTAQNDCGSGRYITPTFFDAVTTTSGIAFGSNVPVSGGGMQTLYMDIYEPEGDTVSTRPCVLVAFGGSFIGGSRADVAPLCIAFAQLGYVAVAHDYRVGFFLPNAATTTQAVMRCSHDMLACVRYLHKSVIDDNNPYRIDPARIIVGGVSAGAIGALHVAYLDQSSELPPVLYPDTATLGGISGNSGSPGYPENVLACWSMSGALGDTSWIQPGDEPLVSVHESGDEVVPCFTEMVEVIGFPTGLYASGGHDVHLRMENMGVENCYLQYPGNGHVGYLNSDPEFSFAHVTDFLAEQVCNGNGNCGTIYAGVEETVEPELVAYPNPTEGPLNITVHERANVEVMDATGRVVMTVQPTVGLNVLDLSGLRNGLYTLRTGKAVVRVLKLAR
ncbi:MAG: T9SS type A sorting domain-containing protein [Flavobacteriales bacterium]|nr:MAG: T9SS type A sorting domain-containing protein [Flavobacteriales bacterium]